MLSRMGAQGTALAQPQPRARAVSSRAHARRLKQRPDIGTPVAADLADKQRPGGQANFITPIGWILGRMFRRNCRWITNLKEDTGGADRITAVHFSSAQARA